MVASVTAHPPRSAGAMRLKFENIGLVDEGSPADLKDSEASIAN